MNDPDPTKPAGPALETLPPTKEFAWKPYGLVAAVCVGLYAILVQYLAMQGAVLAGILSRGEQQIDATLVAQAAAWAAAPFILFSMLVEPLVRKAGAIRAVLLALIVTLAAWSWAAFEAWRAAHGVTLDSVMPANGLISGAMILVLPLPLFLAMAITGRFLAGPLRKAGQPARDTPS